MTIAIKWQENTGLKHNAVRLGILRSNAIAKMTNINTTL